jgi:hypothetical protein
MKMRTLRAIPTEINTTIHNIIKEAGLGMICNDEARTYATTYYMNNILQELDFCFKYGLITENQYDEVAGYYFNALSKEVWG